MSRRAGGYAVIFGPRGIAGPTGTLETDTITCCHCNAVVHLWGRPADECGGFCGRCMKATCQACADKGCRPFEQALERMEARGRLLAAITGS